MKTEDKIDGTLLKTLQNDREKIEKLVSISIAKHPLPDNKISDEWPKVLYRTETVEVWPHFSNSNYYHVRFPNGAVFYAEKEYLERQFQWNGNLDFSHALRAMKDGKKVRRASWPKELWWIDLTYTDRMWYTYDNLSPEIVTDLHSDEVMATDWEIIE